MRNLADYTLDKIVYIHQVSTKLCKIVFVSQGAQGNRRQWVRLGGIGVASYGALGHVPPPRLPASYFERTRTNFKRTNTENYKNNAFLRNFYHFLAHFLSFFAQIFRQGVTIVPKMPERSPINFNSTRTSDSGKTGS